MKFEVTATEESYFPDDERVARLRGLGFNFTLGGETEMLFIVPMTVEIRDLCDLIKFCKRAGAPLILTVWEDEVAHGGSGEEIEVPQLEVYNDYRE